MGPVRVPQRRPKAGYWSLGPSVPRGVSAGEKQPLTSGMHRRPSKSVKGHRRAGGSTLPLGGLLYCGA
jgi:hypothetical protein